MGVHFLQLCSFLIFYTGHNTQPSLVLFVVLGLIIASVDDQRTTLRCHALPLAKGIGFCGGHRFDGNRFDYVFSAGWRISHSLELETIIDVLLLDLVASLVWAPADHHALQFSVASVVRGPLCESVLLLAKNIVTLIDDEQPFRKSEHILKVGCVSQLRGNVFHASTDFDDVGEAVFISPGELFVGGEDEDLLLRVVQLVVGVVVAEELVQNDDGGNHMTLASTSLSFPNLPREVRVVVLRITDLHHGGAEASEGLLTAVGHPLVLSCLIREDGVESGFC